MKNNTEQFEPSPKIDSLVTGGLILLTFILYTFTLAPTVLEADAGEFQFVPWLPGIAHPTGYPLYILMGWLWTHLLPFGPVAWRMNLLSAVFAALAVGATYLTARHLLNLTLPTTGPAARVITAAVAAATLATTRAFWSQAIIAEVYALHTLFVALLIWLALKIGSPGRWGWLLAVTFGLGLTHHVTTILFAPAILLYLWWARPPDTPLPDPDKPEPSRNNFNLAQRRRGAKDKKSLKLSVPASLREIFLPSVQEISTNARQLITICGLVAAPLLLYLYLPAVAPSTPYATIQLGESQTLTLYDNSFQGLLEHVTGAVFSGQVQPAAVGIERLGLTWQLMRQQFGWFGTLLMVIGLFKLWQQRRIDLLILTGIAFIAVVSFNLVYFIGDVFVLFIPAWLIGCLWLGVGTLGLVDRITRSFVQSKMGLPQELVFERLRKQIGLRSYRLASAGLATFFFVLPLMLVLTQISEVSQRHAIGASNRWQQILSEPIPNGAVLISNDRNEIMPMWYYQFVENRRTDLQGLFPLIVPEPEYANVGRVLDQALASGRPVYLVKSMDGLSLKANLAPEGSLFRASTLVDSPAFAADVTLPQVEVLLATGETAQENVALLGYDLSSSTARPGDTLNVSLYWQVIKNLNVDYTSYVHLITPGGSGITQSDHRPGGDYYPSSMWRAGETLRDTHTLTIPADAAPGSYRLRVGMYYQPQPGQFKSMGDGAIIGMITIEEAESLSNVTGSKLRVAESGKYLATGYRLSAIDFEMTNIR